MAEKDSLWELLEGYDEGKAQKALEKHQKEAEELRENQLAVQLPTELGLCLDAGAELLKLLTEDGEALAKLPRISKVQIDSLGTLRLALWQAELDVTLSLPSSRRERLVQAAATLRTKRKQLFGAIDYIWPDNQEMQAKMAELRKGTGYADLADDGQALAALFRQHQNEVQAWLQPTKWDELIAGIDKLSQLILDLRQDPIEDTARIKAEGLRHRIYTLYQQVFDELARGGRYLYDGVDAARTEAYAPLYTNYLRRLRSSQSAPATVPSGDVPEPPNPA